MTFLCALRVSRRAPRQVLCALRRFLIYLDFQSFSLSRKRERESGEHPPSPVVDPCMGFPFEDGKRVGVYRPTRVLQDAAVLFLRLLSRVLRRAFSSSDSRSARATLRRPASLSQKKIRRAEFWIAINNFSSRCFFLFFAPVFFFFFGWDGSWRVCSDPIAHMRHLQRSVMTTVALSRRKDKRRPTIVFFSLLLCASFFTSRGSAQVYPALSFFPTDLCENKVLFVLNNSSHRRGAREVC